MLIENIKRWQWVPIGAVIGFAIAAVRTQTGATTPPDNRPGLALLEFADLAASQTPDGQPVLRNLTIYPPVDGKMFVTGEAVRRPNGPNASAAATYRPFQLSTPVPFHLPQGPDAPSPTYTVRDYLAEVQPSLSSRYAWYGSDGAQFTLWTLGSAVVIGGLWPVLLNLLVGAGYGRKLPPDPAYDLDRFASAETPPVSDRAPVSPEDTARLEELNQSLESQLAATPAAPSVPAPEQVATPIKRLSDAPIEPNMIHEPSSDDPKDYKGEFYPVARAAQKHD